MKRVLLGIVFLAGAGRLPAQVSLSVPDFGAVRAGETARIEWKGLPEEAEELELLLSLEGVDRPIRLTPQLAARAGVLLWRVPNLPSKRAWLRIRFGLDGQEIETGPGAPIEILPAESEVPAAILFHDGEWWAQEGSAPPLGLLGAAPEGDRIREEREGPSCSVTSTPAATGPGGPPRPVRSRPAEERTTAPRPFPSRKPLEVPARI